MDVKDRGLKSVYLPPGVPVRSEYWKMMFHVNGLLVPGLHVSGHPSGGLAGE